MNFLRNSIFFALILFLIDFTFYIVLFQIFLNISFALLLYCCRFNGGKVYTYIGEVCVSVNPYKTTNIYDVDHINKYKGTIEFEKI